MPELVNCGRCVDLLHPERTGTLLARIALVQDEPGHLKVKAVALYVELDGRDREMIWHEPEG